MPDYIDYDPDSDDIYDTDTFERIQARQRKYTKKNITILRENKIIINYQ